MVEAPHGQAQATAPLLQSREVVEVEEMLQPSPIGVTEAGLEAPMCPRIAQCSRWGEVSTLEPLQSLPLAIPFPRSPLALELRGATQAPVVGTDLMRTTRTQ